jgi:RluA family pseudouridine synthase
MRRKAASIVPRESEGSMLDAYLAARFTYLDLEAWRACIADGLVFENGSLPEPGRSLRAGDLIRFDPSSIEEPEVDSSFGIVYEDEDFLIIEKSGSLPCHPGGRFFANTLWSILLEDHGWIHISTRLDRETSGLVLACKSPEAAKLAQGQSRSGEMRKEYLAIVHGEFPARIEARGFLVRDRASLVRKKRSFIAGKNEEDPEAEPCASVFELIETVNSESGPLSLIRALPETGRTHQLRASLASFGFPIVGDKLYGLDEGFFLRFASDALTEEDRKRLILPNQALHCSGLTMQSAAGVPLDARSAPRWGYPYRLFAAGRQYGPSFPASRRRP